MSLTANDEVFRKTNHDELELLEANYYKLPFCDEDMKQYEAMDSGTEDWVNSMLEERFMNANRLLTPSSPCSSSASLSPSSNSSSSSASNTNEHTYSLINDRPDTPLTAVKFEDFSNDYQLSDPDYNVYFVKDDQFSPLNLEDDESQLSPKADGNNFTFESTPDYFYDDFNAPESKRDSIHRTMDRTLASAMEVTGNNVITISKMGNTVHVRKEFESSDEPMDYSMANRTRPSTLSTSSSYSSHCSDNHLGSISSSSNILALAAEAGQVTSCAAANQQHVLNQSDKATMLTSNGGHTAKVTTNAVTHRTQIQIPTSTLQTILKSGRLITKLQQEGQFLPRIKIKTEPYDGEQQYVRICQPQIDVHLPPTPPSSNTSDNEGSSSPRGGSGSALAENNSQISASLNVGTSASQMTSQMLTSPQRLTQSHGPLYLTEEEKRTLMSEGYQIPVKLPLTKGEEKALKKIRRKIKNKISAQESRRKKKEYVEALERKMESFNQENGDLRRKLDSLENSNQSLLGQLRSLQMLVAEKMTKPSRAATTQTSSCLMVLVLCFAVFLGGWFPILSPSLSSNLMTTAGREFGSSMEITGNWRSRVLVSFQDDSMDKIGYCTGNDCYGHAAHQGRIVKMPNPDFAAQDTSEAATAGSETYDEPASGRIVMNDTGDQIGQIIANTMEPRDVAAVLASRKLNVDGKKSGMAAVEIIAHDTKKLVSVGSHISE